MKTQSFLRWSRTGALCTIIALFLAGCLEKRLIWSPDGSRAIVISADGLLLCSASGELSGLLTPEIYTAAWLGDSEHLVVARHRELREWARIAPLLAAERARIEASADELWRRTSESARNSVYKLEFNTRDKLVEIAFRDRHSAELQKKLSPEAWKDLEAVSVDYSELLLARVSDGRVDLGRVLHQGLGQISDIRPAPGARAVAFTSEVSPNSDELQLLLVSLQGEQPAQAVAQFVSAYADWTADGSSLVYIEAGSKGSSDKKIAFGAVTRRQVLNLDGTVELHSHAETLAGVMFNPFARVRCLRDGRILFNAAEISLPMSTEDYSGDPSEQLFEIHQARRSTLTRLIPRMGVSNLPQTLSYFEVSPDETEVVFGGIKGEVSVLALASGKVSLVQGASSDSRGLPQWRRAGEFSYVRFAEEGGKTGPATRRAEIVLRKGTEETVLSSSWNDETLAKVIAEPGS